jgi:hypothetical protein
MVTTPDLRAGEDMRCLTRSDPSEDIGVLLAFRGEHRVALYNRESDLGSYPEVDLVLDQGLDVSKSLLVTEPAGAAAALHQVQAPRRPLGTTQRQYPCRLLWPPCCLHRYFIQASDPRPPRHRLPIRGHDTPKR